MSAKEKYRQMMKLFPATHSQSHIMNLINDLGMDILTDLLGIITIKKDAINGR